MSDLWRWVLQTEVELRKKGQPRLAEIIDKLPSEVCDDRHARADALAVEGVALAKSLEMPWVEIFLRHWHLQSRVFHRMEGESALRECVDLVDFAHGEGTKDCPQSVCVVQDLAACYGFVDGPGYAEERLSVADETLARIDPSWPCFSCISGERSAALRAQGKNEEALAFLDQQVDAMVIQGKTKAIHDMPNERVEALIALGRFDDVLAFLDEDAKFGRKDAHHMLSRRIDRARALGHLGRFEEAVRVLPQAREIAPTPFFFQSYAEALALLVRGGRLDNEWALGRMLRGFIAKLSEQGCPRTAFELCELEARLALERNAAHVARRGLAVAEDLVKRLRKPLGALDVTAKLRAAIEAAPAPPELPDEVEGIVALLGEDGMSAERAALILDLACQKRPAHAGLARARANALRELGFAIEASEALEALYDANPDDDELGVEVGRALLDADDTSRFEPFVARMEAGARADRPSTRGIALFLRAVKAFNEDDYAASAALILRALLERPEDVRLSLLGARVARKQSDWQAELAALDRVIAAGVEPGVHDWDRMIAATMLGAWDRVRDSATRLGMQIEREEGEIDETWAPCLVRFDGEPDVFAVRTGPVTARVLEMSVPGKPQHFDEVVVFEARPLNQGPANDEEKQRHTWIYPVVATLRESRSRVFFLDGAHPGDEVVKRLEEQLQSLGGELRTLSNERYKVGENLPGFYAGLSVPKTLDLKEASGALKTIAEEAEAQLTWPDLAEAAGDLELAEEQRALAEELGL